MGNSGGQIGWSWPLKKITHQRYSEVLGDHNPLAIEIAAPLFEIGVRQVAITERIHYHSAPDYPVKTRTYHIFNLVLQGGLYVQVGPERRLLKAGELSFSPAGSPYRLQSKPHGRVRFLYVEVYDLPYWLPLKEKGPTVRPYEYADQFYLLLEHTLESHQTRKDLSLARANSRCLVELLKHERQRVSQTQNKHGDKLRELVEAIRQNPQEQWDTTDMAKKLSMSRATLSRNFQKEYGFPPKVMVIRQRMAKATELLDSTNESIENIAREVGYESPFTFSNIFKEYIGIRPSHYRERES